VNVDARRRREIEVLERAWKLGWKPRPFARTLLVIDLVLSVLLAFALLSEWPRRAVHVREGGDVMVCRIDLMLVFLGLCLVVAFVFRATVAH
jgi:hypothetical protein